MNKKEMENVVDAEVVDVNESTEMAVVDKQEEGKKGKKLLDRVKEIAESKPAKIAGKVLLFAGGVFTGFLGANAAAKANSKDDFITVDIDKEVPDNDSPQE